MITSTIFVNCSVQWCNESDLKEFIKKQLDNAPKRKDDEKTQRRKL